MLHSSLAATVAAERHAELLRAAESRRRSRTAAARGRGFRVTGGVIRLVAAARARIAAAARPAPDLCCG